MKRAKSINIEAVMKAYCPKCFFHNGYYRCSLNKTLSFKKGCVGSDYAKCPYRSDPTKIIEGQPSLLNERDLFVSLLIREKDGTMEMLKFISRRQRESDIQFYS